MEKVVRVDWTDQGKLALRLVYDFHLKQSELAAEIVVNDIIDAAESIVFVKQYQVDDINPKYRRIVIRGYKVLYVEKDKVINIMDVVSTKQSPEILEGK